MAQTHVMSIFPNDTDNTLVLEDANAPRHSFTLSYDMAFKLAVGILTQIHPQKKDMEKAIAVLMSNKGA